MGRPYTLSLHERDQNKRSRKAIRDFLFSSTCMVLMVVLPIGEIYVINRSGSCTYY
uniref:G_PROTEIN_RECEP_F1_2 domain-containing protein n=1 Tax=Heterorhabditis bacteriophora TaxID=37862 RepID=A0A1I7WYK2_HETBA